ncbi:hypothetical protein [Rhodospirillum sp. A1_3_36]|uniref:hypothetical protein n=1 Tax=Rhodospirillum sp. A1_3_36 TaxID=3391666 RepID=UPI0039A5451F
MNRRIAKMLTKFGVDGEKILAEAAAKPPTPNLLRDPALLEGKNLIRLNSIGTMDAMLELALGNKPSIPMPKDPKVGLQAIILFLRLNHTPWFSWKENDTPAAWSTRVMDALFHNLADQEIFTQADFLALDRLSSNPLWNGLFGYTLDLFLNAISDPTRVSNLDKGTSQSAVQAFKSSADARQARLPKVKYGNSLASFKDVAEYAIGEYLAGLDVNEALERHLVQAQLGLEDTDGKARFQKFLSDNRIEPDTFPTTVAAMYQQVRQEVRFQESEGEVAAVCYTYAQETGQTGVMDKLFANFADPVFPVAAKCRKYFHFGGIAPRDAATVIARWAARSKLLSGMRKGGMGKQVEGLMAQMSKSERKALMAFRDGRTEARSIGKADVDRYVKARCKMLTLSAQQAKIGRVEKLLMSQIAGAEQFIMRPGQEALKDMTYGVDVFFRALRTVMEDICNGTGSLLREQMKVLHEFEHRYGPLPTIALLCPMPPGMSAEDWLPKARVLLNKIENQHFHVQDKLM